MRYIVRQIFYLIFPTLWCPSIKVTVYTQFHISSLLHIYTVKKIPDENPAITGFPRTFQLYLDFYPLDIHPEWTGNLSKIWKSIQRLLEENPANTGCDSRVSWIVFLPLDVIPELVGLPSSNIWMYFQISSSYRMDIRQIEIQLWLEIAGQSGYSWIFIQESIHSVLQSS